MNTIGWLLILVGIVVARQVSRGRIANLTTDLSDAFIAVVSGDSDALGGVLARGAEGEGTFAPHSVVPIDSAAFGSAVGDAAVAGGAAAGLSGAAIRLGSAAKGYRWASIGPDYYDCSGLMYAAAKAIGYKGGRFTTATVRSHKEFKVISMPGMQGPGLTGATVNDIVLWPAGSGGVTGHMGVITGPDKFYSARSPRSGIGNSPISTFRKTRPIYLRYVG